MRSDILITAVLAMGTMVAGCGDDATSDTTSPFVGSWTETQPSGATFLWVIEEAEDGYVAHVYTDQAEWCDDEPYWSEHEPEMTSEVTMDFTGVVNQCLGEEPFANDFYTGRLVYDPDTDTMRDEADPEDWAYERDNSTKPEDLYPDAGT